MNSKSKDAHARKGMHVTADKRNIKVVAALFITMTLGAGLLLLLEPYPRNWSHEPLLIAQTRNTISDLTIYDIPRGAPLEASDFDGVLYDDGRLDWRPADGATRLAVVEGLSGRMEKEQKRALLNLFGELDRSGVLSLQGIALDPASDPRSYSRLSQHAKDLCDWLVLKGFIR